MNKNKNHNRKIDQIKKQERQATLSIVITSIIVVALTVLVILGLADLIL